MNPMDIYGYHFIAYIQQFIYMELRNITVYVMCKFISLIGTFIKTTYKKYLSVHICSYYFPIKHLVADRR